MPAVTGTQGFRKKALVTGANSGIGKAAAKGLAKADFDVTLVVRDAPRGQAALAEIQAAAPGAALDLLVVDLSSQKSIREGAEKWRQTHGRLDVLVNVAGVFLKDRSETEDGIERTFATNYLAYFLLTHELLPALLNSSPSRIVNVSSRYGRSEVNFEDMMVKQRDYSYLKAVPQTMVARVLFTQALSERLAGTGVVANAVHPGLVKGTQLLNEVGGIFRVLVKLFGKTPEKGADTVVWLATAQEAAKESGKLWAKRKPLKTPGQGSDPAARKRLWDESERLTGARNWG